MSSPAGIWLIRHKQLDANRMTLMSLYRYHYKLGLRDGVALGIVLTIMVCGLIYLVMM